MKNSFFSAIIFRQVTMMGFLFWAGVIPAQQLSSDPLYSLVFEDNFDSLNTNSWRTSWYWGNNMWNANYILACDSNNFPGRIVDIAYNTQPPDDTNRLILDTLGNKYMRLVFNREDFYAHMWAYHRPCPSDICSGYPCYYNSSDDFWYCYYDSLVPYKFSGAMLMGKEKYKYGYVEMRYKLRDLFESDDNAYGPNLWMWHSDSSVRYSEIDIFEQRGKDWRMAMNFHFRKFKPDTSTIWKDTVFWHGFGNQVTPSCPYPSVLEESLPYNGGTWHVVGCEWTPDHIDTYYDSDDTIRRFSASKLPVYRLTAMPLIVDCYMPAVQYCIPFDDTATRVPFFYDIDYIRVYQINQSDDCESTPGYFAEFDTNDYESILYRDLTVGGGGGAVLDSGSFHLAGQDFVLLQSGFEVSGTADVIISTTPCQNDQYHGRESGLQYWQWPDPCMINDMLEAKNPQ